jgi:hypothetical protein
MNNLSWGDAMDYGVEPDYQTDLSISDHERDIIESMSQEMKRLNFDFDFLTCLMTIKKLNGIKGTYGTADQNPGKGERDQKINPGSY